MRFVLFCLFAGKYVNHKGRNRNFTNPEELEAQRKKDEEEKKWRKTREQDSDEDEDEDGDGEENDSDESESEEEENAKGAAGVIQIQNPNRVAKKSHRKVEEVAEDDEPQLTRREKEELEKQRAAAAYQKRHAEGKTAQAKADLARLAIIKQHRAEAAARREAEKKGKCSLVLALVGRCVSRWRNVIINFYPFFFYRHHNTLRDLHHQRKKPK